VHRLTNRTADPLEIVEVQMGAHLAEDDIERLNDDYGRH
jgi:mannose-6-phosphate isomerase-like protein (cupin superfamily)